MAGEDGGRQADGGRLYRIGEVVRLLDLGQYTLKHYERMGIVHPVQDPQSGVRSYTSGDVRLLILVRALRRMEFSVDETAAVLALGPSEAARAYEAKRQENLHRIHLLEQANYLLERRQRALEDYLGRPEGGAVERMGAFEVVRCFKNDEMPGGLDGLTSSRFWKDSYENARFAVMARVSDCLAGGGDLWWGPTLMEDELDEFRLLDKGSAERSGRADDPGVSYLPEGDRLVLSLRPVGIGAAFGEMARALSDAVRRGAAVDEEGVAVGFIEDVRLAPRGQGAPGGGADGSAELLVTLAIPLLA